MVLLDASVLYPAPLRDLLMHVALKGLCEPKWSAEIHAEWINAVLRQRPDLKRELLERTRQLMDDAVLDATVSDFASEAATVQNLPDPGDIHVVAAAIKAEAETILTFNLKHFPSRVLAAHGLRAVHPDAFLCGLFEAAPEPMGEAVRAHWLSLRKPPKSKADYLETLAAQKLTHFAKAIRSLEFKREDLE